MTRLSVFSRRRMYGRTSVRSGSIRRRARRVCSRLTNVRELPWRVPSRPGFRKSNSDHRSDRRFSTGVPVSAMRLPALQLLDGPRLLGAGVLDRLGLVEDRQPPAVLAPASPCATSMP